MVMRPVILLDDGGVMNDNVLRGEQWPYLVGEFFAPRLGGTEEAWALANHIVIQRILEPANWLLRMQEFVDYTSFEHNYWLDWLGSMCQRVGVSLPPEEECIELGRQAEDYIIPRVRSAFPGACEAIRLLYEDGYIIHTASTESSVHLTLYLEGMGVRDCFGKLYGTDLLNIMKEGPEYYHRLFADLQLSPAEILVVDDRPRALTWARELGAHTVLVGDAQESWYIANLSELPAFFQNQHSMRTFYL